MGIVQHNCSIMTLVLLLVSVQGVVYARLAWWESLSTWARDGSLNCFRSAWKRFQSCWVTYPRPWSIQLGLRHWHCLNSACGGARWLKASYLEREYGTLLSWDGCCKTMLGDLTKMYRISDSRMASWVMDTRLSIWQESGSLRIWCQWWS